MSEKVLETKFCSCWNQFEITDKDLEFYEKISPVFDWIKYEIPTHKLCPDCILQDLFTFRNERNLYRRKCDLTGSDIISIFSPDKNYKVYDQKEWWSDKWNSLDYGVNFDFSVWAFIQFERLFLNVPKLSLYNTNTENSDYNNWVLWAKDSYMNIYWWSLVNSHYTSVCEDVKDSLDIWWSAFINNCYECVSCDRTYNCHYCIDCSDWINLLFCDWCLNCSDCMFCYNLKNQKYHIENKQYTKEEYEKIRSEIDTWNYKNIESYKMRLKDFTIKLPHKSRSVFSSLNCTWDYIFNSINSENIFTGVWVEDCKNVFQWWRLLDVYDCSHIYDSKLILNSVSITENNYWLIFCANVSESRNMQYCIDMQSSNNCFLSTWLRNSSYCILNKQYTKDEYEVLVPKIINHMKSTKEWWEFFPSSISPFWYNETVANEYYPLTQEQIKERNYKYCSYQNPLPKVDKIIPANKLPEHIKDIPDDILNWAIECEITNKPFRIISQELNFYRKHNLPIPRRHPDQRHLDRMKLRNPRKLYDRHCDKCWADIRTTYAPGRSEVVYCKECYEKTI